MPLSYNQYTLEKIESVLKTQGYRVRYEKGNFKTAACLLQSSRIVVVNKFSTLESKINSLVDLLQQIPLDESLLEEKQRQFLSNLKQTALQL
ncbi:hypothetical protein [Arcticibacter sp. MXS-1]|uniref:hypothetical protein n=1 Tax=Arcticibacter sp. MXS-1 TaxID=3341726 RepID=UPI0035A895CD